MLRVPFSLLHEKRKAAFKINFEDSLLLFYKERPAT